MYKFIYKIFWHLENVKINKWDRKLTRRLLGFKTEVLGGLDPVKCVYLGQKKTGYVDF